MCADITMSKSNIDQNEVKYGAAMSEATFTKIGGAINFINGSHSYRHTWNLNGRYSNVSSGDVLDGLFVFMSDVEVVGFSMSTAIRGTVSVDILKLDNPADTVGATIFKTDETNEGRPKLHDDDGNLSYLGMSLIDSSGDAQSTVVSSSKDSNAVLPVFSTTEFGQFEAIYLQVYGTPSGDGEDLSVNIYFRPR